MALTDDLVSYYKLDETSGATADDAHGSNDGAITGATLNQTGIIGTAFDFDSTDDKVVLTNLHFQSNFSLSFWFSADVDQSEGHIVSNSGGGKGWFASIASNGKLLFSTLAHDYYSTATYDDANYHHVLVTYDGTNFKVWIDGSLDIDQDSTFTKQTNNAYSINLACYPVEGGYNFGGLIDEVAIWDAAIDGDTYASLLYNAGAGWAYPFADPTKNFKVNVGDAWKEVGEIKINVGDVWKDVASASVNVGDAWKTIF